MTGMTRDDLARLGMTRMTRDDLWRLAITGDEKG